MRTGVVFLTENLFYKTGLRFSMRGTLIPVAIIFSNVWLEKLYKDTGINYIFRLELTDDIVFQDILLIYLKRFDIIHWSQYVA